MNAPRQEYCYAVLNAKTERLILTSGNLPIFWSRKVAKEYNWTGTKIVRISLDQLHLFLNDSSAPIRQDKVEKIETRIKGIDT
mgnify:FL=1